MGMLDWLRGAPKERQPAGFWLEGNERVAAVGEASYQSTLLRLCGAEPGDAVGFDCTATLVAEPTNPYDPNAVQVYVEGEHVAYLSRADALAYQPAVRQCAKLGRLIICPAYIAGRGAGADTENLGIFLHLTDPDEALVRIVEA